MESKSESEDCLKTEDLNKDETRIPRPPNAFMIYGKQFRKVLAKKNKNLSNKDVSKLLGDEWRRMDGMTKSMYHRMADEAHKEHLQKYPGYYYSPLEARQRKAERKRKSKMSRTNRNTNDNHRTYVVDTLIENRPLLFPNSMYPMIRPMFGSPFHSRIGFGQQFFRFRPNYSFGGFVPFGPFPLPYAMPQPYPMSQVVKSDRIDDIDSSTPEYNPQLISIDSESDSESNEVEVEANKSGIQVRDSAENSDFGLLSQLLPPMHNPNIEATPVQQNEHYLSDHNSIDDNEVTKMINAIVEQEFVLPQVFKEEVVEEDNQLVLNESKVINEVINRMTTT